MPFENGSDLKYLKLRAGKIREVARHLEDLEERWRVRFTIVASWGHVGGPTEQGSHPAGCRRSGFVKDVARAGHDAQVEGGPKECVLVTAEEDVQVKPVVDAIGRQVHAGDPG